MYSFMKCVVLGDLNHKNEVAINNPGCKKNNNNESDLARLWITDSELNSWNHGPEHYENKFTKNFYTYGYFANIH